MSFKLWNRTLEYSCSVCPAVQDTKYKVSQGMLISLGRQAEGNIQFSALRITKQHNWKEVHHTTPLHCALRFLVSPKLPTHHCRQLQVWKPSSERTSWGNEQYNFVMNPLSSYSLLHWQESWPLVPAINKESPFSIGCILNWSLENSLSVVAFLPTFSSTWV